MTKWSRPQLQAARVGFLSLWDRPRNSDIWEEFKIELIRWGCLGIWYICVEKSTYIFVYEIVSYTVTLVCGIYLTVLAFSKSCSALRTSSFVFCKIASTLERLWTFSLISSARCLIWRGEAGMESSNTRFATASILSGSASSSTE